MSSVIEIENLSKYFQGKPAVKDLNLRVERGQLFGFVGPNGAGKTSTIRIMATLLKPTRGHILIGGHSVTQEPMDVRRLIGYMPDFFGVYTDLKVWEYLDFFASCYHIPTERRDSLVSSLLELVELEHRREDMVDQLSRGMKQRLSLARTLLHDPEILVLDEPASGLDPRARVEIRELLVEMSRMGKTIFFSTHILSDVAEICTRIGIIEAGELITTGTLDELRHGMKSRRTIRISFLDELEKGVGVVEQATGVNKVEETEQADPAYRSTIEIQFTGDDGDLSALLELLIQEGIRVIAFEEQSDDLEQVFMYLTKGTIS